MRFLIISDTHDIDFYSTNEEQPLRRGHAPKVDVVLHCGDFTENGAPDQILRALTALGSIDAELRLLIAGNHEASLDTSFFVKQGGASSDSQMAHKLLRAAALEQKVCFLDEGTHTFTLKSGATFSVYASPYTPKHGISAFQYDSSEDRFNPLGDQLPWATSTATVDSVIHPGTDIVMTHGPPKYVLDRAEQSAGCEHLRQAICRVRPKIHCFGHVHGGYGVQRLRWQNSENTDDQMRMLPPEFVGRNQAKRKGFATLNPRSGMDFMNSKSQTLFVNAAIQNCNGVFENAPWVVDLELPIKARVLEKSNP